jgi:ketopantoate hydroxymethyltransferase
MVEAAKEYAAEVREGRFPAPRVTHAVSAVGERHK